MYISAVPQGGGTTQILQTAIPVPSVITDDYFDTVEDFAIVFTGMEEVVGKEKALRWLQLGVLALKYNMPNPVTETVNRRLRREIMVEERKRKGRGDDAEQNELPILRMD